MEQTPSVYFAAFCIFGGQKSGAEYNQAKPGMVVAVQ
jgi:hypothetical protein